ncbi:hypothetical protein [Intrasporangium sp.]|uniref:hypothetical protein n=1 Tax=Intrasporangium sp. TaxID=1925024 RepID=UPI003221DD3F
MHITRNLKALGASALAAAFLVTGVGTAQAASNHAISGTVYSPCSSAGWAWYNSSTARYKEGTGAMKVIFSDLNKGGLNFKSRDASNLTIGNVVSFAYSETDIWRTQASSVANGRKFYNSFKQVSSACNQKDYNFSGTQSY